MKWTELKGRSDILVLTLMSHGNRLIARYIVVNYNS